MNAAQKVHQVLEATDEAICKIAQTCLSISVSFCPPKVLVFGSGFSSILQLNVTEFRSS